MNSVFCQGKQPKREDFCLIGPCGPAPLVRQIPHDRAPGALSAIVRDCI